MPIIVLVCRVYSLAVANILLYWILRDAWHLLEQLSALTLEKKDPSGYIEPAELIASLTREY